MLPSLSLPPLECCFGTSPIQAEKFRPDPNERRRVRAKHAIADDALVFLYLGRLLREKGVVEIAHARNVPVRFHTYDLSAPSGIGELLQSRGYSAGETTTPGPVRTQP